MCRILLVIGVAPFGSTAGYAAPRIAVNRIPAQFAIRSYGFFRVSIAAIDARAAGLVYDVPVRILAPEGKTRTRPVRRRLFVAHCVGGTHRLASPRQGSPLIAGRLTDR
jgi:hypothetical protein